MKPGAPWSIKGIEPDAREAAKEKAREAGMTLGQWLNQAIAESGQPRPAPPPPTASTGGALDTARIMRAIAEVARRVDLAAATPAEDNGNGQQEITKLGHRIEELAATLPQAVPAIDQSRLERGLVAIARRIDQVEKAINPAELVESVREEIRSTPPAASDTTALEASLGTLADQLAKLDSRLIGIEADLASTRSAEAAALPSQADVPDVSPQLDQLSQDVRKLMNGMVNLAAKVDSIDDQVEGRLQPLQSSITDLQSDSAQRTDNTNGSAIQAAVAAALLPVTSAISGIQEQLNRPSPEPQPAIAAPEPDVLQSDNVLDEAADLVVTADTAVSDPSAHLEGLPESLDTTTEVQPVADEADRGPENGSFADDGNDKETLSGIASLHDLTRADDIQVRAFDDDEGFFRDIDTSDSIRPVADDAVSNAVAAAEERTETDDVEAPADAAVAAAETPVQDQAAAPAEVDVAPQPAAPLDHVPDDAAPPDRPRRLVPVESLLARPGPAPASAPADETSAPAQHLSPDPAPSADAISGDSASQGRRPFRLDEPLDLSRQAPAPPPASYPGGRRWLGYLLVALFFLALFVGGFWFTGTPQFRDIAADAGKLWDQAVTAVKGVDFESDSDEGSAAPAPGREAEAAGTDTASPAVPGNANGLSAAAPVPGKPESVQAEPEPQTAAIEPQTETAPQTTQPTVEAEQPAAATPAPAPAPKSELEQLQDKARAGDADAQYALGVRHRDGIGVEPNYSTAADWFDSAAQQGHVPAQLGLGIMYRQGLGRARDLDLAKLWLHAAARAGEPDAQKLLGEVYVDDTAGVPDYFQAARWFRQAAEQGVVDAQYNMGVLYEGGLGVPRDFAQAYYWFSLAARSGDTSAPEDRERVAQLLTPEQRQELDAKVANFSASAAPVRTVPTSTGIASREQPARKPVLERRDEIRVLQQLLIARGYDPGVPDGIPGNRTRQAIQSWQSDQGMADDGRVTRNVLESLKAGG